MSCRQTPNPAFTLTGTQQFGTGPGVQPVVSSTRIQRPIRSTGIPNDSILQIPVQQQFLRQQLENQNLQTQVTAANAAAAAAAAGGATSAQLVQTVYYTLVATQLKTLNSSPVQILVGSGQIQLMQLFIHRNQPAALFFSRNADLYYSNDLGTSVLGQFGLQAGGGTTQNTWGNHMANSTTFNTSPVGQGITIKSTGDNDLGFDPTNLNTVILALTYRLLNSI